MGGGRRDRKDKRNARTHARTHVPRRRMAFSSRSRSLFDMRVLVFAALVFVLVGALPGKADDTSALSMGGGRNHHHARRIVRPLAGLCDELANDVTALGVDLSDPYAPALVESFPTKCMVYRSPAGSKDAIIHVNAKTPPARLGRRPRSSRLLILATSSTRCSTPGIST